MNADLVEYTS